MRIENFNYKTEVLIFVIENPSLVIPFSNFVFGCIFSNFALNNKIVKGNLRYENLNYKTENVIPDWKYQKSRAPLKREFHIWKTIYHFDFWCSVLVKMDNNSSCVDADEDDEVLFTRTQLLLTVRGMIVRMMMTMLVFLIIKMIIMKMMMVMLPK